MKIIIDKNVFKLIPLLNETIILVKNANVSTSYSKKILEDLRKAEQLIRNKYQKDTFEQSDLYRSWMGAYSVLIENIKGENHNQIKNAVPSHIALIKRVLDGKDLPNINPMVNFYNMLSLKYEVPIGVEDLDQYYGDLQLCISNGQELFSEIGSEKYVKVCEGELIWKDALSATCRIWNWRQSDRTKTSIKSKNMIFIIDSYTYISNTFNLQSQLTGEIAKYVEQYFNTKAEYYSLTSDNPILNIDHETKDDSNLPKIELNTVNEKKAKGNLGIRGRKPTNLGLIDEQDLIYKLTTEISQKLNIDEKSLNLSYPQDSSYGDISSTIAFILAKEKGCSPREAAEDFVQQLKNTFGKEYFEEISIASNSFINMRLSVDLITQVLFDSYQNIDKFGNFDLGQGKKFLIESPSWNPNKTAHVGHALNLFIGKSLVRLFQTVGYDVVNDNITNDKGLPVMQTIWAYIQYGENKEPQTDEKSDHFVHKYYQLGKAKYDEDDAVKDQVKEILRKWEAGDEKIRNVWKKIIDWAFIGQEQTVKRVGEEVGYVWFESDVYQGGKEIIEQHIDSPYLEKIDGQAVIARIEQEYGLPDTILIKSDGTGLYHTQDIYLTIKKKEKFNPDKLVWVVGEEQITHFQRLFAILDALKIMLIDDLYHYPYSHVVDKDGKKLSSRDGDDLSVDELMQMMQDRSKEHLNGSKDKYSDLEIEEISRNVSIGALKYTLLSRDPFKKIKFDLDESLSYQGKSGPYIMYAYTRAKGILERVLQLNVISARPAVGQIDNNVRDLMVQILKYPGVILSAANNYSPAILSEYLYDIAKSFSNFYEKVRVVDLKEDELIIAVLTLQMFMTVIKKGLGILGIEVTERM